MTIAQEMQVALDELVPLSPERRVCAIQCSPATANEIFNHLGPAPNPRFLTIDVRPIPLFPDEIALLLDRTNAVIGWIDGVGTHWI